MIVLWSIVFGLVLIRPALAQETGGGGTRAVIRDESGNPIPDVALVIEAGGHRRWLKAGPDGSFAGELPKGYQLVGMTPPCFVVAQVETEAELMRLTLRRTPFDTSAVEPRSGATSTLAASMNRSSPVRPAAATPVFTSLGGGPASSGLSKSQVAAVTRTPASSSGVSGFTSNSNLFSPGVAGRTSSFAGGNYNFNSTNLLQSSYWSASNLALSSQIAGSSNLSRLSSFSSFSSPISSFSSMNPFSSSISSFSSMNRIGSLWTSPTWSSVYSPISSIYSSRTWSTITSPYTVYWDPRRYPAKGIQVMSDFDCRKLAEESRN